MLLFLKCEKIAIFKFCTSTEVKINGQFNKFRSSSNYALHRGGREIPQIFVIYFLNVALNSKWYFWN